jgi:transglutaminase-like putative cysteine protease
MIENDMRHYRVEHHTAYRYSEPVVLSHQQLHLTPRPLNQQRTQAQQLVIEPAPTLQREFIDPFGNPVTEIAIESAHTNLEIVARTHVSVMEATKIAARETPGWEAVREMLCYRAAWHPSAAILEATQFLFESPHARVKRELRAYAMECFAPNRSILEAATALMEKIHGDFKFDRAATIVSTPVMKFFQQKRGVCQDFAHLMIAVLRSFEVPARYVSGYIHRPNKESQSHAWCEAWLPDLACWVGVDPTNDCTAGESHVKVAIGRDFSDVPPNKGIYRGQGQESISARVETRQLDRLPPLSWEEQLPPLAVPLTALRPFRRPHPGPDEQQQQQQQ